MLRDITLGQYYHADSPIHRMDPRVKIVLTMIFLVCVLIVQHFVGYAYIAAFLAVVVILSNVPPKKVLKSILPIVYIMLFTFIVNILFFNQGEVLYQFLFIKITTGGIRQAFFMGARLMLLVFGTSIMTLTTSPIAMTDGMESLMKPLEVFKFPAHELAMMMSIALRFIPTLMDEADKIMKAQLSRGADFESGNIFKRAKAMIPILVPLFVSAFHRADELAMAMESRCYTGGEGRTRMKQLKTSTVDYVAIAVFAALLIVIIFWG